MALGAATLPRIADRRCSEGDGEHRVARPFRRPAAAAAGFGLALWTVSVLMTKEARATPSAEACTVSYESAQQHMRTGALLQSRNELDLCTSNCPRSLAQDCESWRDEVVREIPTLNVEIQETAGTVLRGVHVVIDGVSRTEPLTGTPIEVDPGKHSLVFEDSNHRHVEISVDVPSGKKGYSVVVRFPVDPPRQVPLPPPQVPATIAVRRPSPVYYVIGGLGLAGVTVGAALGMKGQLDRSGLIHRCAPRCLQADVDAITREWTVGGVVGGLGGVTLVVGVFGLVIAPKAPARTVLLWNPVSESVGLIQTF